MPQYLVKPANRILARGDPDDCIIEMEVGANATAAKMVPGRAVIYDAVVGAVKEAGAKAQAVLGVLEVKSGMKVTDNYAVGDACNVIYKPGAIVLLTLVTGGGAVTPGAALVSAADGKFALQAVGALGTQGGVCAICLGSEDPAAADKTVLAMWLGLAEADTAA